MLIHVRICVKGGSRSANPRASVCCRRIAQCSHASDTYAHDEQFSVGIELVANRSYYIEAVGLDVSRTDHLSVGFQRPGWEFEDFIPISGFLTLPLELPCNTALLGCPLLLDPGLWTFFRDFDLFEGQSHTNSLCVCVCVYIYIYIYIYISYPL